MSDLDSTPWLKEFQAEDAELARQLLSLNQSPSPALHQRLQAIPHTSRRRRVSSHLAWGAVVLMLGVMLFASPTAKAMLWKLEKVVGQIHLTVMEAKPTATKTIVVESVPMSLAAAQAAVSFDFAVPSHIPANLIPNYEVSVIALEMPFVKMLWRDIQNTGFVQLTAHSDNDGTGLTQTLIGPESSQPVSINGRPGVIVYGGWDESNQTWSHQDQLMTLIWKVEGVQYKLLAFGNIVSLTDLKAMAESVR